MPRLASLLWLLPLGLLASCSSFDQQWSSTTPPQTANPAAPLAGKWEGSWQSDSSDYHGTLRAVIVPLPTTVVKNNVSAQQYRAQMKLMLFEVLSNEVAVTLNATPKADGRIHFEGKVDRGVYMGGIFYYDGYVDDEKFFCDYTSDDDCGTFKMHRIVLENQ
jgi:hypothetical protein